MTKLSKKSEQNNCSAQPKNKNNGTKTTPLQVSCANVSRIVPENEQKTTKTAQFDRFGNLTDASRKTLQKRAKAKYFTNAFLLKLIDLNSYLKKSYWNTWHCTSILVQTGQTITAKYCNNRWCLVCNRIRTAKLIIAYREILASLPDKQFVTLTIPNIAGDHKTLRAGIMKMKKELRRIQNKVFAPRRTPMQAVCKLECTYNAIRGDYHPHFHLIVARAQIAEDLRLEWLKTFPEANPAAQDIRPGNENSVMELFKYFTKIISKGKNRKIYPAALDTIFQAMRGLRVFQPIGISKEIPEDVSELESEMFADMEQRETLWNWEDHDWIDRSTSEVLADYTPSEKFKEFRNNL